MVRLLTGTEAAARLSISRSAFYASHRAMGLYPIDMGVNGKPLLRWPADEVERYLTRKLAEREQGRQRINQIVRHEKKRNARA
jgi:predicted DNA-binding transcriptional regulator AlpA